MRNGCDMQESSGEPAALAVIVELVGLCVGQAELRWSISRAFLAAGQTPDELARSLAGASARSTGRGVVLHSTSWRHGPEALTVTYALFPDPRRVMTSPLAAHHLVTGTGPLHPSPVEIGDAHVAAHAVRHLGDLAAGRDPHVVGCTREQPEAWRVLAAHAARVHAEHAEHRAAGGRRPGQQRFRPGTAQASTG